MKIDSIIDALDFYNINNDDYRQKCYEIEYTFNLMLEDRNIKIWSYNLE